MSLAVLASTLLSPSVALAHASDRGFVLLLPTGYYLTGGALAVAASFAALTLIPPGVLQRVSASRFPLFAVDDRLRLASSLAAFLGLGVLVAAGFAGSRDPLSNPLPLTVWTLLWIGLTLVQGLLGDVWRWINPWYAPVRLVAALARRARFAELPPTAGWWPAVVLFLAFAWFELIYPAPDDPWRLAAAVSGYFALNLVLAVVFGADVWLRRGECLSAFFGMVARFGIVEGRADGDGRRRLALRWPGAGLGATEPLPTSGVLFILLVLGSVSFDGLSRTFAWLGANGVNPLEFPGRTAMMGMNTAGLVALPLLLAAVFYLAVWMGERLAGGRDAPAAAAHLVWSIVPIALAYHMAHYLTALTVNGQYALVALSDPFALGWNLFGTADNQVSAGIVSGSGPAWLLWNLQAAAIVGGHILAVLVAHLIAGRRYPTDTAATLSQLPLALLMVGYTVFGLWLLSTPTAA
ncbi:MAG: hypothetical protein KF723_10100 [Rhizobiaceae bacterium]|nr:hypothetical protein [Rhizobiaceae bacterium]